MNENGLNKPTIDNFFDNFDYSLNESLAKSIELLKADDKDTKLNALRNYSMSLYDVFSLDNIIENLNYVVSNSTPSYRDYFYLGLCYLDKEDYLSAVESFLKGIDINEKDYGLNYNLAISYYFNYELDKAEEYLYKAISIDNIRLNAYQVLNYIYNNNFEEPTKTAKIKQFLSVIDKNITKTGDKNLLFLGANYNFEAGNFSKALEYLDRLTVLDSKNSDYFLLRVRIYFQIQNYDNSKKDVELVLENDINNLEAHCLNVQIAYTTNNITEQTLKNIEIVIENSEKVDNYFNFIAFKTKADNENNIQQSIDYYTKALLFAEEQNDIAELYSKRADAYSKLDNLDLAENDILHALDFNESDVNPSLPVFDKIPPKTGIFYI